MNQDHHRATRPLRTHWRPASCDEVDCPPYLKGWVTVVPATSPQAEYIRHLSGRQFKESGDEAGLARFEFEAGQTCFGSDKHRLPLEKLPIFSLTRRHDRRVLEPDEWVESFQETLDRVRAAR